MSDYLNIKELMSITGLKRGMIGRLMNKNDPAYDSAFPSSVPTVNNALRWRRADVEHWQSGRELDELEAAAWAESTGRARADLLNRQEIAAAIWGICGIHRHTPKRAMYGLAGRLHPMGRQRGSVADCTARRLVSKRLFRLYPAERGSIGRCRVQGYLHGRHQQAAGLPVGGRPARLAGKNRPLPDGQQPPPAGLGYGVCSTTAALG